MPIANSGKLLWTALLLAASARAADYRLELNPENTRIEWTLPDPLHTVAGTFRLKRGRIDFSTDSGKASGEIVVDVASGESGNQTRDRKMHREILESARFPDAVFIPASIEGTLAVPGGSQVKLHGAFTIHGASHEIAMDAQVTALPDRAKAVITFEIPYVAWGMKDPSNFLLRVGKTVRMSIDVSGPLNSR